MILHPTSSYGVVSFPEPRKCPLCGFYFEKRASFYVHIACDHMLYQDGHYHCSCGFRNQWVSQWMGHVDDFDDFAAHYHDHANAVEERIHGEEDE